MRELCIGVVNVSYVRSTGSCRLRQRGLAVGSIINARWIYSSGFLLITPPTRTRAVLCNALRMHLVTTNITIMFNMVLLDTLIALSTDIVINLWARPLVSVALVISKVEVQVAINAMFCHHFGHIAFT